MVRLRRYKDWEAKPPQHRPERTFYYDGLARTSAFPVTERTVVMHLNDSERWYIDHLPWIRAQRLAMINYAFTGFDIDSYGAQIAVTFRTKEQAALFKLFWFE